MATDQFTHPLPTHLDQDDVRAAVDAWRAESLTVALIPTMGALHDGHLSLVAEGLRRCDRAIASIFVNPRQFAPHEDLDSYPRTLASDLEKLAAAGCHAAYAPSAARMYPAGFQTSIAVGALAAPLCGLSRPHFFGGVATVVGKLLMQVRPDAAIFGQKDYQQLQIVRRMALDLDIGVEIVGAPTVRSEDGLAMSSRNAYLSAEERRRAVALSAGIRSAAEAIAKGVAPATATETARVVIEAAGIDRIDYLEARRADDLELLLDGDPSEARVFVAAFVGRTRLIDNWPVPARRA